MRGVFLAAFVLAAAYGPCAAAPADDGRRLMGEGRYSEAVASLEAEARESPGSPDVLLNLGWAYWHDQRVDDAYRTGVTLVKLDPTNAVFLVFLANTNIEKRRYRSAEKLAERALAIYPENRDASLVLARARFLGGRQKAGLEFIEGVIARFPDDSRAVYRRAEFLSVMGRKNEALESLNRLLDADPGNPAYRRSRAKLLNELGRQDDAVREWKDLAAKSQDPAALLNLGWAFWREKQFDEAMKAATVLLGIDPQDPVYLRFMANLELERMRYDEALRLARKALSLAPGELNAELILAKVLFRLQREAEAEAILEKLNAAHPDSTVITFRWAEFLVRTGRPGRAVPLFDRLIRNYPSNETYRLERAGALADLGLFDAAVSEWTALALGAEPNLAAQKRLRDDAVGRRDFDDASHWQSRLIAEGPSDPMGWERLATLQAEVKRLPEALAAAERAIAVDPGSINPYYLRAELLGKLGRLREAEAAYGDVLVRNPGSVRALDGLSFVLQSEGRYAEALKTIRRIEDLTAPTRSPYVEVRKARLLADAGRPGQAQRVLRAVKADPGPAIPVLLYHGISRFERSDSIPMERFRQQMLALKDRGYETVTASELDAALRGEGKLPRKPLLLTFDDARTDSFQNADPVLVEAGFRATMFVHVSELRKPHFHASPEDLRKWQATGRWELQAHGYRAHDPIPIDAQGRQGHFLPNRMWLGAENRLEDQAEYRRRVGGDYEMAKQGVQNIVPGREVVAFAYPYGDYGQNDYSNTPESARINQALVKKNFHIAFVQEQYGVNTLSSNPTDLRRFEVNRGLSVEGLTAHLALNDPRVQAELLDAELWMRGGQLGRAHGIYSGLQGRGVDEARVWVDQGAAFQKSGDLPRARRLYASAARLESDEDSRVGARARTLERQLGFAAAPVVFAQARRFTDSDGNATTKGGLRTHAFAGPFRLEAWGAEASYREMAGPAGGAAYIRGLEAGAGLRWFPGPLVRLEGSYLRRAYSRSVSASAEEYSASAAYQMLPSLALTARDGIASYETAAAIRQGRTSHFDGVGAVWDPALGWRVVGGYDQSRFNDANRQDDYRVRLTKRVSPGMSVGAAYAHGESRFRAPEYYTPSSLNRTTGVIALSRVLGKVDTLGSGLPGAEALVQYEGGYAAESGRSRVVHSVNALLALRPFSRFSINLDAKYAESPTYISRSAGASLGVSF